MHLRYAERQSRVQIAGSWNVLFIYDTIPRYIFLNETDIFLLSHTANDTTSLSWCGLLHHIHRLDFGGRIQTSSPCSNVVQQQSGARWPCRGLRNRRSVHDRSRKAPIRLDNEADGSGGRQRLVGGHAGCTSASRMQAGGGLSL
eukprot:759747-Hanusia_phi.AAC.5